MTHGTGSFPRYSSFETIIAGLHPGFGRYLYSLLRTAAATLGIGVSRDWFAFADSCSPLREHPHLFCRLSHYVGGLPALPDDVDLTLGMGMERPGPCLGAYDYRYWNGGHLENQDREAIFPGDFSRISKGS